MLKIKKTRLNILQYIYLKKSGTYLIPGIHVGEQIYLYSKGLFPIGIIIGRFFPYQENDRKFFNLEFIRINKKKQRKGIGTKFFIQFLKEYNIKSINYLATTQEGVIFFKKLQKYFLENGIEDLSQQINF